MVFFLFVSKFRAWKEWRASRARVAAGEMSQDEVKPFSWNIAKMGNMGFAVPGKSQSEPLADISRQHRAQP